MKIEIQNEINIYIFKYFEDWDVSYKAKEDLGNLISLAITKTKDEIRGDFLKIGKNLFDNSEKNSAKHEVSQDGYEAGIQHFLALIIDY